MNDSPRPAKRVLPRRRFLLGGAAALTAVVGGGAAWALDRFVIEHVEVSDVDAYQAENATTQATTVDTSDAVRTATSYVSDDVNVQISTVVTGTGSNTVTYYVADVTMTAATVVQSAFAQNQFGENIIETTSAIAKDNGAVFAINGDYYGFRDTGIVIRNGVSYRDLGARQGLAFFLDGHVEVYDETATDAATLLADGVWNTLSFGPAIVENGSTVAGIESVEIDTNFGNHSIQGEQPRTGVGVLGDNHLAFVVVDGRSSGYSKGVTLPEFAAIFEGLGATTAYNLDGGGSSTMYFDGALVNDPLGKGEERGTSDILFIGG